MTRPDAVRPCFQWAVLALSVSLPFVVTLAHAQPASSPANEATQRMEHYEREAGTLSPAEVYKELERQRAIQRVKNQSGQNIWAMDEDSFKSVGYAVSLEKRAKTQDPAASFYFGLHNSAICAGFRAADKTQQYGQMHRDCWVKTLDSFKVASAARIAAASANVGRMYEAGLGVNPSKLVAAEWFVKAADQYNKDGARDEALTVLESALTLAPDHPAALRLKRDMIK